MTISVVIPMAGIGKRFSDAGFKVPKPLIPVMGQPMIVGVIDDFLHPGVSSITLVTREEVLPILDSQSLLDQFTSLCSVRIEYIKEISEGPADTVRVVSGNLDPDAPLIIANSDQKVIGGLAEFIEACLKEPEIGRIATLNSKDDKWSFVRVDSSGAVIEVAEKRPISNVATAGIYYFPSVRLFLGGLRQMDAAGDRTNGELYVAPTYNYLSSIRTEVWHMETEADKFFGLGTPEDLDLYLAHASKLE